MKILSLFLFLALSSTPSSMPIKGDGLIPWSPDTKLAWSDFKARSSRNSPHDALSHCGLAMDMSMKNLEIKFVVKAVFDSEESWVKNGESSNYLLAHEQLHFDIYERYARELRKRLSLHSFTGDVQDVPMQSSAIYNEVNDMLLLAQKNYDEETDHSLKKEQQLEWAERIKEELLLLDAYSTTSLNVQVLN